MAMGRTPPSRFCRKLILADSSGHRASRSTTASASMNTSSAASRNSPRCRGLTALKETPEPFLKVPGTRRSFATVGRGGRSPRSTGHRGVACSREVLHRRLHSCSSARLSWPASEGASSLGADVSSLSSTSSTTGPSCEPSGTVATA
eukprot:298306-Pyramimonas_sp.AAC.1